MKNLRIWWQKPRRYKDKEDERRITFLELFYDLIYVVIIAELSHTLSTDITLKSFMEFGFLFLTVWWAWFNGALYHDNHGNNDIRTRVFTFLQMFTVAAMAIFAHNAFGEGSTGFALSYGSFLIIITFLWWRSGYYDKEHRPLSNPYSATYLVATALIFASVFVETNLRFYFWGGSLFLILIFPLALFLISRKKPKMQKQIDQATTISSSMVERFGLITIIVLGEVIVGVIQGVASYHHLDFHVGITAALGMLVAIGLWWLYFDTVAMNSPRKGLIAETGWLYLHLPLTMGITATGAAILNIIDVAEKNQDGAKVLLIGAVAISYLSIALLLLTIKISEEHSNIFKTGRRVTIIAAFFSIALLLLNIGNILLLGLLSIIMLAPVFFSMRVWIKERAKNYKQDSIQLL